jgi:hypothetical protein
VCICRNASSAIGIFFSHHCALAVFRELPAESVIRTRMFAGLIQQAGTYTVIKYAIVIYCPFSYAVLA